jgi:DNA-binding PadR family transcriptional regulator
MRFPIMALLASRPAHGYELKQALESRFGASVAPLNAGQIYTTLGRLERDGLVEGADVSQDGRPNKTVYQLTEAGRAAVTEWVAEPTSPTRLKPDLLMKLVLAGVTGLGEPRALIADHRRRYLQALRALQESAANGGSGPALLAEGAALHLEADLKWLDRLEDQMTQEVHDGTGP